MKMQILLIGVLLLLPIVVAQSGPSAADKAKFDEILTPLNTIYDLVKYSSTAIAALMMLFAGITYMLSAGDPKKKETAKNMATYVIIGLLVIWVAPLLVNLLIG